MSHRRPDPRQAGLERTLRHALRVVDSIEPGADGLGRIRAKIAAGPQAQPAGRFARRRAAWMSGWAAPLVTVWGTVLGTKAMADLLDWAHKVARFVDPAVIWLRYVLGAVVDRFKPDDPHGGWVNWLRPAAAIATAFLVVTGASWAIASLPQVIASGNNGRPTAGGPGGGVGRNASSSPGASNPGGTGHSNGSPGSGRSNSPGCVSGSPTSTASTSPSPGNSSTQPTTSSSPSPTSSPSPSSTPTTSPSPTDSQSSSPASQATQAPAQPSDAAGNEPNVRAHALTSPKPRLSFSKSKKISQRTLFSPSRSPSPRPSSSAGCGNGTGGQPR